jgi:hypothetical protein
MRGMVYPSILLRQPQSCLRLPNYRALHLLHAILPRIVCACSLRQDLCIMRTILSMISLTWLVKLAKHNYDPNYCIQFSAYMGYSKQVDMSLCAAA